eukprot:NODE_912_length_3140_cov_0.367971.p1 type:complete len:383 gc:universal NODE_912_length_3140_cov_0.367971:1364-216(-)
MLFGLYVGFINTTQFILDVRLKFDGAYGELIYDNKQLEFAGLLENNTLAALGTNACESRFYGNFYTNPSRCELKVVHPCINSTISLSMNGYSQEEIWNKNIHLLEYGLYCIILCLIATFFQFRSMSELRAEKIVDVALQVNLIFDFNSFFLLFSIDAEHVDTLRAMVFYMGFCLFFQSRLVSYVEKSSWYCALVALILYYFLVYIPPLGFSFAMVLSLLWCRQIWFCFYNGVSPGFTFTYLASNFLRLFPALYVWACPHNVINFGYHKNQGFILLAIVFIITVVLVLQYFHPRFYLDQVPFFQNRFGKMLRATHNYVSELLPDDENTCGICLEELQEAGEGYKLLNRVMRAPCDHVFHERCLQEWLKVKLQCPICRIEMPPI